MGRYGSLRKSTHWDGNGKKLSGMCPNRYGTCFKAFKQDHEDGKGSWIHSQGWTASGDSCWNDSVYVKAKRELRDGEAAFKFNGVDGSRYSNPKINIRDKKCLRKSTCQYRQAPADGNVNKESGGWPSWDSAMSKSVGKYTDHQNDKVVWDQSREWTTLEDDITATENGVWHQSRDGKANKETHEGGSRKYTNWDMPEVDNNKKESGRWPSWDGTIFKTTEISDLKNGKASWNKLQGWTTSEVDTTMASKNCWNEFENVMAKRDSECSDSIHLDGNNGLRQSNPNINMEDNSSLRKSSFWDRPAEVNGKKESSGWHSWSGSRSKAVEKYTHHQKREGVCNQAQELIALDDGTAITGKGGWNEFKDDKARKETSEGNLRKSAIWDRHEDDNDKKESGGWPSWDGASSMKIEKCSLNQSQGWNSEAFKEKRKLREGGDTFYLDGIDGLKDNNLKNNMVNKCNLRKSTCRNRTTDDIGKECSRHPSWNRARFSSFRKYTSHQNGIKDLNQSQGWNKLKDGTTIEGTGCASTDYRYSPRWLSRRGSQFRRGIDNSARQYSDRERFRYNKKARYPGNDRLENSSKHSNQLKDTLTPNQENLFHGVEGSTFSRNFSSCKHENTGIVSSWNSLKIPNATVTDQLRQSHTMLDNGGFRDETIKSMATIPEQNSDQGVPNSQHWKTQHNISQRTPQNTGSLTDNQNDYTFYSALQLNQNMQVNSQLPYHPNRSNLKVKVQSEEQQAMPMGECFRKNDDICEASNALDLNALPFTALSSSNPVGRAFLQANEESSSSNLQSRFSPVSNKSSKTSEELKSNSTKHVSIDRNLNLATRSATTYCQKNQSWDPSHCVPLADKGIRMFKATLVEFVKNAIKPVWKEGGLSKEAHKTVVKKVVDKVTGVLGYNIPQTQEMIDQYMSFSNDKLLKLTQDYLEMFINT